LNELKKCSGSEIVFIINFSFFFFSFLLLTEKSSNSKKGKLLLWGKKGEKNQGQTKVTIYNANFTQSSIYVSIKLALPVL